MATAAVEVPIPETLKARPMSKRGYLIPWFVQMIDGEPDFRIMDAKKLREAVAFNKCWMCGGQLRGGVTYPFVVGPMCVINCISTEPPSHADCARYAAQVCPFLTRPRMHRREDELSREGWQNVAGMGLTRNPGVAALAFTRCYDIENDGKGLLFRFARPIAVEWYCEGRKATRAEVQRSIDTGIVEVRAACPPGAEDIFESKMKFVEKLLPKR